MRHSYRTNLEMPKIDSKGKSAPVRVIFDVIRLRELLRLGSSVHHFEHVIKQETHIFTKMIINFRFYQNFTQKNLLPNFLENSRKFTKFYQK
jgi:hypothetical protein